MNPIHKSFPGIAIAYDLTPTPLPQNFHMHTHTLFEIYCFLRGKGIYHVEGSKYNLQSGDVLLMRPGEAHFLSQIPVIPMNGSHSMWIPAFFLLLTRKTR